MKDDNLLLLMGKQGQRNVATFNGSSSFISAPADHVFSTSGVISCWVDVDDVSFEQFIVADWAGTTNFILRMKGFSAVEFVLNASGNIFVQTPITTGVHFIEAEFIAGVSIRIRVDGGAWATTATAETTTASTGNAILIGKRATDISFFGGEIYNVNLNNAHYYAINDNSTTITDSIGSNDGTGTDLAWSLE